MQACLDSDIELYAPGLLVVTQQDEQNLFSSDEQVAFKGAMKTLFAGPLYFIIH